jgi:predicted nuclease of predicted toxin-antitoxin system
VKFLADVRIWILWKGVDQQIVKRLRQEGHSVSYVAEMEPGISDNKVLNLANQETAILLTADKDFGEMIFRQGKIATGVILFRLAGLSQESKGEAVVSVIRKHADELQQAFVVITPGMVRIRHKIP